MLLPSNDRAWRLGFFLVLTCLAAFLPFTSGIAIQPDEYIRILEMINIK